MLIRNGILIVAAETFSYDLNISFDYYCSYLQNMADDFKKEETLKSINTYMKDKWFQKML